ncbi:ribonuclease T2-like [Schaereria dolodes]|nr:ribonuclease T2-like [Schaereria dolodes]
MGNTCCLNSPGGQLLQTQFWDTDPATGPADHWTIHGLWPDNCDGTYSQYCDETRQYTNITAILESYGRTSLLEFMDTYWKDEGGNDESFWEHEWGKHGTCINTLDPSCYTDYTPQEEVVDFFQRTVDLFMELDSYQFLADAGIIPTTTKNYTSAEVLTALAKPRGVIPVIQCYHGQLDEIWYFFDVRGNVQSGDFVPETPVGETSDCPANLQYLPKNLTSYPINKSNTTAPAKPFLGTGNLLVQLGAPYARQDGCINAAGRYTTDGDITGNLAVGGTAALYANDIPSGRRQETIYTTGRKVELNFTWEGT